MKYSKLLTSALLGTIASLSLLLTPEKSTAQIYGPYKIVNRQFNKCLDAVNTTSGGNGTKVQLWDCRPNALNQQWYLNLNTSKLIENVQYRGKCLDAVNTTRGVNGTRVQLWSCTPSFKNQKWDLVDIGSSSGYIIRLRNGLYTTKDLDAVNTTGGGNGTIIQLWGSINNARNQHWYLENP